MDRPGVVALRRAFGSLPTREWAYWSQERQELYAKKGDVCLEILPAVGTGKEGLVF